MKKPLPALTQNISLNKRIEEKISTIAGIEKNFPGAIIIHNITNSSVVYMNEWGRNHLGISIEALHQMGPEYHARYFNPEDIKDYGPRVFGLLERNNDEEFVSFFQQVRKSTEHEWEWFLSSTKIFLRDEKELPLLTLTTALPVDDKHYITIKVQRLQEENNFLRSNYHVFDQLTSREKEVLKMMALGHSSSEMAEKLHISETTASTHRRNIKRKLKVESNYDIIRFAQAFDLI
jgi:DNA-binding CsgD family transcriptional regulator